MFEDVGLNTLIFLVIFAKDKQIKKDIAENERYFDNLLSINKFLDEFMAKNPLSFIEHMLYHFNVTVKITDDLKKYIREEIPVINHEFLSYLAKEYVQEALVPLLLANIDNIKKDLDKLTKIKNDHIMGIYKKVEF